MKLLELCTSAGFGGLELYAAKVAQHYHLQGLPVLAAIAPDTLLDERLAEAGVSRFHLRMQAPYFPLLSAWRLARRIREHGSDVLHLHARRDLPLAVFARLLSRRPLRIVYTRQMALTRPKRGLWHRFLYRHVDLYLTITKRLERDARRYLPLPPERIRTLYYGVPKPSKPTAEKCRSVFSEFGLQANMFTVAIFGRIEKGKGQHLVIDAVSRLNDMGRNVQLAIIGRAMRQEYLDALKKQVVAKGLKSRVVFPGFHSAPATIMRCFDAVILATKEETFGLVLAEAQRAGVAVIGSNAGGVPEIIDDGNTGLLFSGEDSADLASALERIVSDKVFREKLAMAGEDSADKKFSENRHFDKLLNYFMGLCVE